MKKICLAIVAIGTFIAGLLPNTASAAYTSEQAFSRMRQLAEQNKVPAYVVEKGRYKYVEGNSGVRVKGKNVFMRSQPLRNARVITKWTNTELEYLGEWTHPKNGERWVCVRRNAHSEIGWIFGQYIEYASEASSVSTQNSGIRLTSNADKEDKSYKKDKDCSEDPCGALGGFLLISPILYFIDKINKERKGSPITPVVDYDKYLSTDTTDDNVSFWDKCCPGYKYRHCYDCDYYDRYDHPLEHDGYSKCSHFKGYVQGSYSPQYNATHVESFADECCPSHRKAHCRSCDYIDFSDEYHGYYRCGYFYAYVDADWSPQYNSRNLKYP